MLILGNNQSVCEKVIDITCSYFVSRSWSRSEKKFFIVVKNKSKCSIAWSHIVVNKSTDHAKQHLICKVAND